MCARAHLPTHARTHRPTHARTHPRTHALTHEHREIRFVKFISRKTHSSGYNRLYFYMLSQRLVYIEKMAEFSPCWFLEQPTIYKNRKAFCLIIIIICNSYMTKCQKVCKESGQMSLNCLLMQITLYSFQCECLYCIHCLSGYFWTLSKHNTNTT